MLVVNDSMVLIHLAKISLLETACRHFGRVLIPTLVFEETVVVGKDKGHGDAFVIEELVKKGCINVKKVKKRGLIKRLNGFNIFGGEAEAIAIYWESGADIIASDDDNVRNKKEFLGINLIGTPSVILLLYGKNKIGREKAMQSISKLRKIGWFSNEVLDKILMEVEQNG